MGTGYSLEGTGKQRIQRHQEDSSSCLAPKQTCNCQYFREIKGICQHTIRLPTDSPLTAELWLLLQCRSMYAVHAVFSMAAEYSYYTALYDGRLTHSHTTPRLLALQNWYCRSSCVVLCSTVESPKKPVQVIMLMMMSCSINTNVLLRQKTKLGGRW